MSDSPALRSATTVCNQLDCSAITLWRRLRNPDLKFPQPLKISGRLYFRADEIDAWIEAQTTCGDDRQAEEA
jgi:predicted DNA-binding transcriptional regulator AlpA